MRQFFKNAAGKAAGIFSEVSKNKVALYGLSFMAAATTAVGGYYAASQLPFWNNKPVSAFASPTTKSTAQQAVYTNNEVQPPQVKVEVLGTIQVAKIPIASEIGGLVKQVLTAKGGQVKGGQAMAVLENLDLNAQVLKAEAALDVAKARLAQTQGNNYQLTYQEWEIKARQARHNLDGFQKAADLLRPLVSKLKTQQTEIAAAVAEEVRRLEKLNAEHKHSASDTAVAVDHSHGGTKANAPGGEAGDDCQSVIDHLTKMHEIIENIEMTQNKQSIIQSKVARVNITATVASLEKQLNELQHQVEIARDDVKLAELQMNRAKAGPQAAELQMVQAQVKQAEVDLQIARVNLEKTKVLAPYPGTVVDQKVNPGEIIIPGTVLFELEKPYEVWFEVQVARKDVGALKQGQKVQFTVTGLPDDIFTGSIGYLEIENVVDNKLLDSKEAVYKLKIEVNNSKGQLKSGMEVNKLFV